MQDLSLKDKINVALSLYMCAVRQFTLNFINDDKELIKIFMSWDLVNAVMISETVYTDLTESLISLIQKIQDENSWVRSHTQKTQEKDLIYIEDVIWTISSDELLRHNSYVYILWQAVLIIKLLRANHNDS